MSPIRELREELGLSLCAAARRAGIDKGQFSRMERGQAGMTVDRLYSIATAFGLAELATQLKPFVKDAA